jgi:4-hydroxy-tetrahydrodipicolinate synthase
MNLYSGVWVALVTPFRDGEIDQRAFQNLVEDLANRGVSGFVPLGTTGEAATLTADERRRIIQLCIEAAGDINVSPGCGTNSTAQTIENVREAAALGATGAMVITPYYNKPTQEGLYRHFHAIADASELPLMLYNVPARTGVNMLPETVARLADHENVDAVKEACGNLDQISELCMRVEGRMNVLSGDDSLTLPVLAVGGDGIVSVVGNVAPEPLVEMCESFMRDNSSRALELHRRIVPLAKAMFLETNPAPIKCALWMEGKMVNELRLPMVPVKAETRDAIKKAMREYNHLFEPVNV